MSDPTRSSPETLAAFEAECWTLLARAALDKRAAMNLLMLATIGLEGAPRARTVVLRGLDRTARTLDVHTDARSTKAAEIQRDPRVALTGWDPRAHVQIRVDGLAMLHRHDDTAAQAWARTHGGARRLYAEVTPPGAPLDAPADFETPPDPDAGFESFAVVRVTIVAIEALRLGRSGHRRARFTAMGATWLAP